MEEQITPLKTGIKYGLYLGIFGIVWQLISHYGGLENFEDPMATSNWISGIGSYVGGFIITFLGIKYFRENNEGLLTFGEGMSVGLFIGLFAGLIGAIFMFIYASYIVPDFGEAVLSNAIDPDEISADEAEAMENMMGFATSPIFMAFSALIGSIIGGVIYGLIGSAILKKGQ